MVLSVQSAVNRLRISILIVSPHKTWKEVNLPFCLLGHLKF